MNEPWQARLRAARAQVLADGYTFVQFLTSDIPVVRQAALEVLATVCWRETDFLEHYFQLLMLENRRA
jgi:hypothetical protein